MKKFLLTVVVAVCSISYASAQQWTDYYVVEEVGQENASAYWFRIDWDGKYFFMDSDSEDEQMAPMKNYKESGNKRTFDVHYTASAGGDKYCSVEFITEGDGKFKLTQTHLNNWKPTYILSLEKPSRSGSGSDSAIGSPVDEGKSKVGKALNKINPFKKKKK